jgi:hypothetical protein
LTEGVQYKLRIFGSGTTIAARFNASDASASSKLRSAVSTWFDRDSRAYRSLSQK